MAYTPTNWANGDVITSEKLNKMEQGIAGSGDVYALHTTVTVTPAETEGEEDTITYSSVELREDGLPMWLIIDNAGAISNATFADVTILSSYDNEFFRYNSALTVNRSTGEVGSNLGGIGAVSDGEDSPR